MAEIRHRETAGYLLASEICRSGEEEGEELAAVNSSSFTGQPTEEIGKRQTRAKTPVVVEVLTTSSGGHACRRSRWNNSWSRIYYIYI